MNSDAQPVICCSPRFVIESKKALTGWFCDWHSTGLLNSCCVLACACVPFPCWQGAQHLTSSSFYTAPSALRAGWPQATVCTVLLKPVPLTSDSIPGLQERSSYRLSEPALLEAQRKPFYLQLQLEASEEACSEDLLKADLEWIPSGFTWTV